MGRELKRVPLDFDWPLDKTWHGYLNPHYKHCHDCSACDGSGYSPEAKRMADQWYGHAPFDPAAYGAEPLRIEDPAFRAIIERKLNWARERDRRGEDGDYRYYNGYGRLTLEEAVDIEVLRLFKHQRNQWCHHLIQADVDALVAAGRLHEFTSVWKPDEGWVSKDPPYHPTAREVNLWSLEGLSHDAINRWVCIRTRCEREGVPDHCTACDGNGSYWDPPEAEQWAEDWKKVEPPAGDAYQIWQTVSEGGPISPPCRTSEELAEYMVRHPWGAVRANGGPTREQWVAWINGPGYAPSMVGVNGKLMDGVSAWAETQEP